MSVFPQIIPLRRRHQRMLGHQLQVVEQFLPRASGALARCQQPAVAPLLPAGSIDRCQTHVRAARCLARRTCAPAHASSTRKEPARPRGTLGWAPQSRTGWATTCSARQPYTPAATADSSTALITDAHALSQPAGQATILYRHALRQLLMDDEPLVGNNLDTPDMLAEGGRLCDVLAPAARSRYRS